MRHLQRPTSLPASLLSAALAALAACGGGSSSPSPTPTTTLSAQLPARPTAVAPTPGATVTTDDVTFTVQNANGFDQGQAEYTFRLTTASGTHPIATARVAAGAGSTSATLRVPRGMSLLWSVQAFATSGQSVESDVSRVSGAAVACGGSGDAHAKQVLDWFIPACSLARNRYNDVQTVVGPPDSQGSVANGLTGVVSLGNQGWVSVDMERCAVDGPGNDVRVFQRASSEPVTLYAAGAPDGPWLKIGDRVPCGDLFLPDLRSGYCEFDLAAFEITEARYFRIEDGEHYPCELATTDSEGADIDAIEILRLK